MAVEHHFAHDWKSFSAAVEDTENISACFDCNICLDFASDPVVTLCGHLYCWPCIYEWFHVQGGSDEPLKCPVCKAELSDTSVVPLYGSGKKLPESQPEGKPSALKVPPRPPAWAQPLALESPNSQPLSYLHNYPYSHATRPDNASFNLRHNAAAMAVNAPEVGMFGEMVYSRVFGNPESVYTYPNSYRGNSSPRLRRQEMQVDKSLNRITTFLFFCFLLCLLLF